MSHILAQLSEIIKDVSVLRRILFAVAFLPSDCPAWVMGDCCTIWSRPEDAITPTQARVIFENLNELNSEAFVSDQSLLAELSQFQFPSSSSPPPPPPWALFSSHQEQYVVSVKAL